MVYNGGTMSTVRELHNKAMEFAQLALLSRHNGDYDNSISFAQQAFEYEQEAAELVPKEKSSEPTRSILYRSAASLAFQAKQLARAQRLIIEGLSGFPPPQIELELNNLYDQVRFEKEIALNNRKIEDEELQLTIRGGAVGVGIVPFYEFMKRINNTKALIDRTIQRLSGSKYQGRGNVPKSLKPYEYLLAAPREGSFIISLKLQLSLGQTKPIFFSTSNVINEVLEGIQYVNDANEEALRELTKSESYYQHFISMTRDMAPDGQKISFVGFTSDSMSVSLSKKRSDIEPVAKLEHEELQVELQPITVEGLLDYATSRTQNEEMGLTSLDNSNQYTIKVTEGMEELVRTYYKQIIIVTGLLNPNNNVIYLSKLEPSENY